MIQAQMVISNKLGLHARAAAKLVNLATGFNAHITLINAGKKADAKNILSVMMLAARKGTELVVEIDGSDEKPAYDALSTLIQRKFDEAE